MITECQEIANTLNRKFKTFDEALAYVRSTMDETETIMSNVAEGLVNNV